MKKLRATQDTQIQGPHGPRYVSAGEVVDLPDNFVAHPDVFEHVREVVPARDGKPAVYSRVPQPGREGA